MADLNFSKVFPFLCSCGNELGYFQKDIENIISLTRAEGNQKYNLVNILSDLELKMCCRTNMLTAPVYMITSIDNESFRDESSRDISGIRSRENKLIIVRGPNPSHNSFPSLPLLSMENVSLIPAVTLPSLLIVNK